ASVLLTYWLDLVFALLFSPLFFFSSRRRHTRSKRDWSSDVCSSDLTSPHRRYLALRLDRAQRILAESRRSVTQVAIATGFNHLRSEERRVGKECRARRSPEQVQNKKQTARERASTSLAEHKRLSAMR